MIHFLIALALCYVLIKIPFWVLGSLRGGRRTLAGSLVRGFIAYKTFGLLRGLGSGNRTAPPPRGGRQKTVVSPNPYAGTRATPTGQYMLPLKVTRVPKPPRHQGAHSPKPSASTARKGKQLMLPSDGQWPENKPRLGRDGQYRLPFHVPRQPKPKAPPPPLKPARSSSAGRQLKLPADGQWPENKPRLGREGQYQLPLNIQRTRTRTPSPPPPAAQPPPRRQAPRWQQPPLPLTLPKLPPPRPSTRRGEER